MKALIFLLQSLSAATVFAAESTTILSLQPPPLPGVSYELATASAHSPSRFLPAVERAKTLAGDGSIQPVSRMPVVVPSDTVDPNFSHRPPADADYTLRVVHPGLDLSFR